MRLSYASQDGEDNLIDAPALAFSYALPVDGRPLLHAWLATAKDIYHRGFESWREPIEAKSVLSFDKTPGNPFDMGCLLATKGLGRISIILFGLTFTYLKLRASMTGEELVDFRR